MTVTEIDAVKRVRPLGVTIAASLMILSALLSTAVFVAVRSSVTLPAYYWLFPVISVIVATGLLRVSKWAYFALLALVVGSVALTSYRMFVAEPTFGTLGSAIRLLIGGFWGWYFLRPQVRVAFGVGTAATETSAPQSGV